MIAELIVTIDPEVWDKGLSAARAAGQYDSWLRVWRIPIEVERISSGSGFDHEWYQDPEGDWQKAVKRCNANGWLVRCIIDPENRPVNFASPQFPAPGNPWYPCTAI